MKSWRIDNRWIIIYCNRWIILSVQVECRYPFPDHLSGSTENKRIRRLIRYTRLNSRYLQILLYIFSVWIGLFTIPCLIQTPFLRFLIVQIVQGLVNSQIVLQLKIGDSENVMRLLVAVEWCQGSSFKIMLYLTYEKRCT